ncbi:MAG: AAA family ATPase [Alphaproteobacteria bacterium]|nr:AAA family ATPase [Alphaproteobacteria bacterium]
MAKKAQTTYNFPHPMDNDTLIGHMGTVKNFMDAWNNRERHPIHPVWMLTGPRGIGKATLAYKLARMVYGNVGDFFIIDQSRNIDKDGKSKPDGKEISVYTVRQMIDKMQLSSMSGAWRVVLIDSLDELNKAASNAILKLLEEPPEKTLFLLVVHQLANVLPTVRSRARVEKMHPLSVSELRELCIKFMPDADISTEVLRLSNGSFGKIADMKRVGGDVIYDELIETLQDDTSTSADLMNIAKKIAPSPEMYSIILDAIAYFGLADLYPAATKSIADITAVHLEPETGIFKLLMDVKKCL